MKAGDQRKTEEIKQTRILVGNKPEAWLSSFSTLIDASEKATDTDPLRNVPLFRVRLMLRGMALECLLKAVLVSNGIELMNKDGRLNRVTSKSHDLTEFSKLIGLDLSKDEIKVLKILSSSIETGRYPITAKIDERGNFWITPLYEQLFYGLIDKIKN